MNKSFRFDASEIGVFREESPDAALRAFGHGCHIIGMTMGQFSLIDLIHAVLKRTGPADLYIATWSAGIKDAHQVRWLMDTDMIRGVRLLTDHSYVNRQKKYAASIEELFGAENIRCSEMHAKFVVIKNDDYNVTIQSSMNLNANRTCETFTVYESEEVTDFHLGFIRHHFDRLDDGWERSSSVVRECAEAFFAKHDATAGASKNKQRAPTLHWSEM